MITQLKAELDRINQRIEQIKTKWKNCPVCGYHEQDLLEYKKQTLKKVSLMWADEMIKIFIKMDEIWAEQPDKEDRLINKTHVINCDTYDELQEIKSLMEKE
jgi:hypothetical protein